MPNVYPLATEMASTPKPPFHSSSPVPLALVPRIDRLDSIMKVLEDQKNGTTSSTDLTRRKMPMDMAVREAQLKGSLMDRVRSLENRLLQLCLEMESSGIGSSLLDTSLVQSLREATSVREVDNKKGSSYLSAESFKPTSDMAKQFPLKSQIHTLKVETKTEMNSEEEKPKNEGDEPKKKPTRSGKDLKIVGMKMKGKHLKWFHLKLLCC